MRKAFILVLLFISTLSVFAFQKPSKKDYLITITTPYGDMKAILFEDTPLHRENFLKLAEEGFYDSLLFHRVINNFMIQGGDPESRDADLDARLGNGGPGYRIPAEISGKHYHRKGAIAAARQGDNFNPDRESSGSQFYIVQGDTVPENDYERVNLRNIGEAFTDWARDNQDNEMVQTINKLLREEGEEGLKKYVEENLSKIESMTGEVLSFPSERKAVYAEVGGTQHLDGKYTVFGQIISGLDVIDKIAEVDTNRSDRPAFDIKMAISVERMRKKKITKLYGYAYPQ